MISMLGSEKYLTLSPRDEARVISHYLIGAEPSEQSIALYVNAIRAESSPPSHSDRKLIAVAHKRPGFLGLLDAGLALLRPQALLRRRIYLMFAILEATPEHHQRFLPVNRPRRYVIALIARALAGIGKAIVGAGLVKIIATE